MPIELPADDALPRRLPLPLAQLHRRARNAKTALERHLAAYYLWEAALKLLASVAVVEYARRGPAAPAVAQRLQALARPAVGHWWEFVRLLVPALAEAGDPAFVRLRELLLGRPRTDCPRAAGLDALLREVLEGKPGARTTVQLVELFHRLVMLRNDEVGHGAAGQRPAAFYERTAPAMLAGVAEVLDRLDVLAGRRLVHVADVRRLGDGNWLVERFDLSAEAVRRLESLTVAEAEAARLPRPGRLYLCGPDEADPWRSLHPLLAYDAEAERVFFLNSRAGKRRAEYLCYTSGEVVKRDELGQDQRELLIQVLGGPVDTAAVEAWAEASAAGERPPAAGAAPLRTVGEFELISRLGRGGMGVVYRAWQPSLGRQVALKCLMGLGDPKAEARFGREIRALGRVDHPNLVKVFTSGSDGEQWFYAMELVEGADLAAVCVGLSGGSASSVSEDDWAAAVSTACERRKAAEQAPDAAAAVEAEPAAPAPTGRPGRAHVARAVEVVRQAAEAAHALHEAGVIHRDIKPGNILLTADGGHAVLADLGLAQLADESEGRLTRTRQFVGTLRYASPEQMLAAKLDRRADVYSLGATLWELLTLRPLYGATDQTPTPEVMLKIQTTDPERVRKHNPRAPADLEAIVARCLEKDRGRRYGTAAELAADLGRWQRGEPVRARPVGGWERALKWVRRHPTQAALYGLLLLVVVLGGIGGGVGWLWLDAVSARKLAEKARGEAEQARDKLNGALQREQDAEHKLTQHSYADRIYLAQLEWDAGRPKRARELLEEAGGLQEQLTPGRRPWEWDYFNRAFHQELAVLEGHTEAVESVAFSPDGARLASAGWDHTVRLWDAAFGKQLAVLQGQTGGVSSVAFSPDGARLASAGDDNTVRLWDAASGKQLTVLKKDIGVVAFDRFHVRLEDVTRPGLNGVMSVAFSPDGRRLASAGADKTLRLWDAASGKQLAVLEGHTGNVASVAFSPDGRRLASAGADKTLRLWDAASGKQLAVLEGHTGAVSSVAFSPDGRHLASAGADKTLRLWDAASGKQFAVLEGHTDAVLSVAFSPDGRRLASAGADKTLRLWDAASGKQFAVLEGHTDAVLSVAFSPDARRLASASAWDKTVRLWDAASGKQLAVLEGRKGWIDSVAFSPDGARLASGDDDTVRLWDAASGKQLAVLEGHKGNVASVAFSPDGRRLASASADQTVRLWDAASGKPLAVLEGHTGGVNSVAFSPDGGRLASASADQTVRLWDAASGKPLAVLQGATDEVRSVAFSPDGARLASAGNDRTVRLWIARESPADLEKRPLYWWGQQAEAAEHDGRWLAARFDLSHLLATDPNNTDLLRRRAYAYAALGQWDRSVADYEHAGRLAPADASASYSLGVAYVGTKDIPAFRDHCRKMLAQFGDTRDASTADDVAYLAVLLPDAVPDAERMVQLAQLAHNSKPDDAGYLETLGAALYRVGRYAEGVDSLQQAVELNGKGGTVWMCFFLAMAHHRLEQPLAAPRMVGLLASPPNPSGALGALPAVVRPDWRARAWFDTAVRKIQEQPDPGWKDKLRWRLLRDEAAAVLGVADDAQATPTPAPGRRDAP